MLAEPLVYERLEASGARVEESLRAAADAAGRARAGGCPSWGWAATPLLSAVGRNVSTSKGSNI